MAATKTRKRKTGAPSKGKRGSKLTAKTNRRRNTKTGRAKMSSKSFALPKGTGSKPGQDQYRIDTAAHARNALARAAQHATPSERATVRRKVKAKFPSIGRTSTSKNPGNRKRSTSRRKRR